MKLTVDIPENDYKFIRDTYKETGLAFIPPAIKCECTEAVYNGTPYEERKTGKWIPVSERLPEKADSYLVTYLTESGVYAGLVEFVESAYWTGLRWQKDCDDLEDVIAWMPCPEPYKEVDDGDSN